MLPKELPPDFLTFERGLLGGGLPLVMAGGRSSGNAKLHLIVKPFESRSRKCLCLPGQFECCVICQGTQVWKYYKHFRMCGELVVNTTALSEQRVRAELVDCGSCVRSLEHGVRALQEEYNLAPGMTPGLVADFVEEAGDQRSQLARLLSLWKEGGQ